MPATILNAQDAAQALGVENWQAYAWLNSGALHGERVGKEWQITAAEIERFKSERHATLEQFATKSRAAQLLYDLWRGEMGTAQREAVREAEQFIKQYRALDAEAKRGKADPAKAEAFGEQSEAVIEAMLRIQAANRLYVRVAQLSDGVDRRAAKLAREVERANA